MKTTKAEQLLSELKIDSPEKIDPVLIANHLNLTVEYEELEGCEASLFSMGDSGSIIVKSSSNPRRKRFSIAHEIGHWIFDKGQVTQCVKSDLHRWIHGNKETSANKFASDLLLPKRMLGNSLHVRKITLDLIEEISEKFDVSITATAIKLVSESDFPACVTFFDGQSRQWIFPNKHVPDARDGFTFVKILQDGTVAKKLQSGKLTSKGGAEVDANLWVNESDAENYTLWEESFKSQYGILTVLSWPKQDQIINFLSKDEGEAESDF